MILPLQNSRVLGVKRPDFIEVRGTAVALAKIRYDSEQCACDSMLHYASLQPEEGHCAVEGDRASVGRGIECRRGKSCGRAVMN